MALALFITPCLCKVFLGSENLNQPAHICVVSKQPNHSLTWAENKAAVLICCHKVEQFVHSCFIIAPTISKRAFLFTWPNYQIWILPFLHSPPETSQEYPTRIRTESTSARIFLSGSEEEGVYLRLDAQRKILAHGYRGFEVLLALLAHKLSPKMRWPGSGEKDAAYCCTVFFMICLVFSPWMNQ